MNEVELFLVHNKVGMSGSMLAGKKTKRCKCFQRGRLTSGIIDA